MQDEEQDVAELQVKKKKKGLSASHVWAVVFMLISGGLTYLLVNMSFKFNKEIISIRQAQDEQFVRHTETNQFLLSTIDWSSRRAQLVLFMRDQIVRQWKTSRIKIDLDEAYIISETILRECESYQYIDPFMTLATQCIESKFQKDARSKAGALGINQIMPSTGRIMAGHFGLEYTDSLLYRVPSSIQTSTRFAVKLFDFLYAQHQSWELVLADYNGGPYQAYYYKHNKTKLAEETRSYVPNVLNKKKEYDTLFVKYRIDERVRGIQDSSVIK